MANDRNKALEVLEALVVVVMCLPVILMVIVIADGWVLQRYWEWFVVSVSGVETPELATCIGLSVLASFLVHKLDRRGDTPEEEKTKYGLGVLLFGQLFYLGWILGIGYIVHS